jgi:hypothetical protein
MFHQSYTHDDASGGQKTVEGAQVTEFAVRSNGKRAQY